MSEKTNPAVFDPEKKAEEWAKKRAGHRRGAIAFSDLFAAYATGYQDALDHVGRVDEKVRERLERVSAAANEVLRVLANRFDSPSLNGETEKLREALDKGDK